MSGFIRPEMARWFARWGEPLAAGIVALVGARILWRGLTRYDWMLDAIGAVLLLLGLAAFWAAFRRAQFKPADDGPGLVAVTERRITYMSGHGGGFADIHALRRIELRSAIGEGRVWVLKHDDGPSLEIPLEATGAEALFDAFAALPGIDMAALIAARKAGGDNRVVIWRAPQEFRALT